MFTKKTNFKPMKADAIVAAYSKNVLVFWVVHALTVIGVLVVAALLLTQKITVINAGFSGIFLVALNYLLYAGRTYQYQMLNQILNQNCDPVKSEKVFQKLYDNKVKKNLSLLNVARAQYYQGKFQEGLDTLQNVSKPKADSIQIFVYYQIMAGCYEGLDQMDMVIDVRERVKKVMNTLKENSPNLKNGQQVLTIIDGILTFHEGSYTRSREIYEELFENSSFPLSRMTVLSKLAKMEQIMGSSRSAIDHCEYILETGGTTFYMKEAREILALCRPKKKSANSEPAVEVKEAAEDGTERNPAENQSAE